MSIKYIRILPILFALLITTSVNAQQFSFEGMVTTFDTIPLVKAQISLKSTKGVFETDIYGHFITEVSDGEKLTISAEGFNSKTVKVKGDRGLVRIDLKLRPGDHNIERAINDGHHIRVSDQAKFRALSLNLVDYSIYSNIYDAVRSFGGVNIVGDEILIRGKTSFTSGNNSALLVVDGVIVSQYVFGSIPTSDIRRIKILKGSEAAIYGSQGGNGAVEVETKRGIGK
jgi:TonB-dependent SusC/RagA subfamily outer membrane receptor